MSVPGIETWLLIFTIASVASPGDSDTFLGGEYQTKTKCQQAVVIQYSHWHLLYGSRLSWRCELMRGKE
jgi:hypothetical protein